MHFGDITRSISMAFEISLPLNFAGQSKILALLRDQQILRIENYAESILLIIH